jgi:hypothetical protein
MIKQIMIPMAAFAVTATAASAFNPDMLEKIDVDLTDSQVSALEEAHELKTEGVDSADVKTFLEDNGVDADMMKQLREAGREYRNEQREEVHAALENNDYEAFVTAVADSPLASAIATEADFETFKAAHELKEAGDHEGAKELMEELDIERPEGRGHKGGHKGDGSRKMDRAKAE